MFITTEDQLERKLKVFKVKLKNEGFEDLQLYPLFCVHYDKHKELYQLPQEMVLDKACDILIEGSV